MTQQPPTGVGQAELSNTPSSVDPTTMASTAVETLPSKMEGLSTTTPNPFSEAVLKGIAASALEQPSNMPLKPTAAADEDIPVPDRNCSTPPPLKFSTTISPVSTPSSNPTEFIPQTLQQPVMAGKNVPAMIYESAPLGPALQPQQPALHPTRPTRPPLPPRQYLSAAGKRPSMRQVGPDQDEMTPVERETRTQKIRDIISEQFGLEILLKHRELQDIEAELGKAEACLEQIRRCAVEQALERDGRLNDPSGVTMRYTPAPEVMNGPYSGQYSNWLMEERVSNPRNKYHDVLAADQSRNFSIGQRGGSSQQGSRPQREAASAAQREKAKEPAICLHRQLDGTIVRLACTICKRDQFGSMQGFLNHCRLAHGREFETHDTAAAACGTPFNPAGYLGPLPPPRSNKASKYAGSTATPPAPKTASKPSKSGSNTKKSSKANNKKTGTTTVADEKSGSMQAGPLTPPLQAEDGLRKTIQTSHLKQYLGTKNVDIDNLDTMVEEAVNRVGIVEEESEHEEEEVDGVEKKDGKAVCAAEPQLLSQPEAQPTPPAQLPQASPPAVNADKPTPTDIVMVDLTIDTSVGNAGGGNIGPTSGGGENTGQDEGEQSRPVSRRSNPGSSRQSPRTPVAPSTRMGTRAHPGP